MDREQQRLIGEALRNRRKNRRAAESIAKWWDHLSSGTLEDIARYYGGMVE